MDLVVNNGKVVEKVEPVYSLLKMDADAVRTMWPTLILPGLLRIKEKDKTSGHWTPEHVRLNIEAGFRGAHWCQAHLIMDDAKGIPVGFVILKLYNDEFISVPTNMHIWIVWCEDAPMDKVLVRCHRPLLKIALDLGLTEMTGITSRYNWMKRIAPYGWKVEKYLLKYKVPVKARGRRRLQ